MTYEEVKRIRNSPSSEDVDNDELSRMIDKAIDKQIAKKPEYEAIREEAERLKEMASQTFWESDAYVGMEQIDRLVKEMTGQEKNDFKE